MILGSERLGKSIRNQIVSNEESICARQITTNQGIPMLAAQNFIGF